MAEKKDQVVIKPRKHARLYQMYLALMEAQKLRIRHGNRVAAIEDDRCNYDLVVETQIMSAWGPAGIEALEAEFEALMVEYAREVGPVWDWLVSLRGVSEASPLAAKLLALIDDISTFSTVSKLWRKSGHGLYQYWVDSTGKVMAPIQGFKVKKGERKPYQVIASPKPGWELKWMADRRLTGWCSPYDVKLRSTVWMLGTNFLRCGMKLYAGIAREKKIELRREHPIPIPIPGSKGARYSVGHIHNMGMRAMRKVFLAHLWYVWRDSEGLPVSAPYIQEHGGGGHTIVPPPNWPLPEAK